MVLYKNSSKCSRCDLRLFFSFEILAFVLKGSTKILCILVYRSPKSTVGFIEEFPELLSIFMPEYDNILILGDFNVHVCCLENPLASEFLSVIDYFNLVQAPTEAMHNKGHMLDLVLFSGRLLNNMLCREIEVSE